MTLEYSPLMKFGQTKLDNEVHKHLDEGTSPNLMEKDVDTFGDDLEMLAEMIRCKNEELRQLEKDSEERNRNEPEEECLEQGSETVKIFDNELAQVIE